MFSGLGRHAALYVDPPWAFNDKNTNGNRGAGCKYPVMTLSDLMQMPVNSICADDCVLFMWWVASQPQEALDLVKAWGFTIKNMTAFTWLKLNPRFLCAIKKHFSVDLDTLNAMTEDDVINLLTAATKMGLGHWTRASTESCLIAVKGRPKREYGGVREIIIAPLREHSRKPDITRDRISTLVGNVAKAELFARAQAPGWSAWGNQTNTFSTEIHP